MSVVAVVPTFRPEAGDLRGLVESLQSQDASVLISDDGSPATSDGILRALSTKGVTVLRHRTNAGIARGLNDGLRAAVASGTAWLLTVDQDSTVPPHLVADLLTTAASAPHIGAVGVETIGDAAGDVGYPTRLDDGLLLTEEVFQTGTLWSVSALTEIGGFDERLGIDAVDAAACLRLRERGYRIALAPGTRIGHRYGEGRQVTVLGRTVVSTGHSPARRESMVRNRLALAPAEFRQSPRHALRTLRRVAVNLTLAATVEDQRLAKLAGGLRGLRPGR